MRSCKRQRPVLWATAVSYMIVILDTSIVNVALERIAEKLAGGIAALQWVVTAYTLSFASLLLTGGALTDRLGARSLYICGLATFALASAFCGFAPSVALLVVGRMVQGVGAALLVPASLTLINETWPDPGARAAVVGLWTGLGGVAMASGPLVGGMLIRFIGWRSIFLVNVPICLAGIWLVCRVSPERSKPRPAIAGKFDLAGQVAAIVSLVLLNLSVISAPHYGWRSPVIIGCMAATLATGVAFLAIEATRTDPMVPLNLFRNAAFSGAVWVSMVSAFTFYGLIFDLGLLFQRQLGYSPLSTGLAFLPLTVAVPAGSLFSKRLTERLGPRRLVVGAFLLAAGGYFSLMEVAPLRPYALFALPLPAIGLAASLITPVTTTATMASVDRGRAGIAAGVLNAARQTGAVLGVAWSGALLAGHTTIREGMQTSLLIAGLLSAVAGAIWWRALRSDSVYGDNAERRPAAVSE
ncbi:MFS transporter [Paraburkholderia sprentiae WSM5005]|uniref:MFS transporter n=2 Tax=Paraburkholderia sprentiae TaxID=948107 RepID=A0A1I9YQQ8_9BURK|nr:MFS transporter [Paraburkholderia sprentiae WSM5005]